VSRPKVFAKNIIMGTLYIDYEGEMKIVNHRTQEQAVIQFYQQGWSSNSRVEGSIQDSSGTVKYKI
jgi:hypothetical protein